MSPFRLPSRLAAALLAAGLCITPAAAQDPSPAAGTAKLQRTFDKADTNQDGKLSEDEAKAAGFFTTDRPTDTFSSVDQDKDGQVTLFELGDAIQKRIRQYMSDRDAADTDQDGYVSEEEAKASGSSILDVFKRADIDGDGKVARDEIDIFVNDTYYSETADRGVVPNIINKKF